MGKSRTPLAKAKLTGADIVHPERFKGRKHSKKEKPLGNPTNYLNANEKKAWRMLKKEFPWLLESDRAHVEIVCLFRGKLIEGERPGVQALNAYRAALAQMGGNPADKTKVFIPNGEEEEDPLNVYF